MFRGVSINGTGRIAEMEHCFSTRAAFNFPFAVSDKLQYRFGVVPFNLYCPNFYQFVTIDFPERFLRGLVTRCPGSEYRRT